jgi:hypothetical protein
MQWLFEIGMPPQQQHQRQQETYQLWGVDVQALVC